MMKELEQMGSTRGMLGAVLLTVVVCAIIEKVWF
jgi:hypothetical protein